MSSLFRPVFIFAVGVASSAAIAVAVEAAPALGKYDCGPYQPQFSLISCDSKRCNMYTYDKGARGGGFSSTIDLYSLNNLLTHGAPNNGPCTRLAAGSNFHSTPPPKPKVGSATSVALGKYECYTMTSGHLYSAMSENMTITGPGSYKDVAGRTGTFTFTSGSGAIVFHGAALNGQRAVFKAGVPPLANNPNNITFLRANGELSDSCDGVTR